MNNALQEFLRLHPEINLDSPKKITESLIEEIEKFRSKLKN